jgi:hypothetical protein
MKKTIIAASIAAVVAAPAAFADLKISGNVIAEYVTTDGASDLMTNNDINLTAKEDLGNGLTATAKLNNAYDDGTQGSGDMSVSLSGDFGAVTLGRIEGFQEGAFDAFVNVDAAHDGDIEGFISEAGFGRSERAMYVSPSFNGLQLGVTMQDNGDDIDGASTEVMATYSNAGLKVMAGISDVDGGNEYQNVAVSYKMGGLELRAMHRSVDRPAVAPAAFSLTDNVGAHAAADVVAAAALVLAGDAANGDTINLADGGNATINTAVQARAADSVDTNFLGAKYAMGNNTISFGHLDDDLTGKHNVIGFAHSMSKSTTVYASFVSAEDSEDDNSVIGIAQKF